MARTTRPVAQLSCDHEYFCIQRNPMSDRKCSKCGKVVTREEHIAYEAEKRLERERNLTENGEVTGLTPTVTADPETAPQDSPAPTSTRRKAAVIDETIHNKYKCFWPCPCGGTVPDAPDHCKHRRFQERANTWCVDVLCCVHCDYATECPAYLQFKRVNKVVQTAIGETNKRNISFKEEAPTTTRRKPAK